jgi:hypothetical protein
MTTQDMLTALQSTPNIGATAPSIDGFLPLRAWVCYRAGDACHVQIATEERQGETTVFRALTSVPMRDDWQLVTP